MLETPQTPLFTTREHRVNLPGVPRMPNSPCFKSHLETPLSFGELLTLFPGQVLHFEPCVVSLVDAKSLQPCIVVICNILALLTVQCRLSHLFSNDVRRGVTRQGSRAGYFRRRSWCIARASIAEPSTTRLSRICTPGIPRNRSPVFQAVISWCCTGETLTGWVHAVLKLGKNKYLR
jgi:hypothetical protein